MFDFDELKEQAAAFFDAYGEFKNFDLGTYNNDKTLILVVDMVKGFCTSGALASPNCNAIASGVARLLQSMPKARKAFIRDCHDNDSAEFACFPPHCLTGDKQSELVDELLGFDGIDIPKNSTNAFFKLMQAMPTLLTDFKRFVIVGVCTDICVLQLALTLKTALNENNQTSEVAVISSLTQTFDLGDAHKSGFMNAVALKLMQSSGINIFK